MIIAQLIKRKKRKKKRINGICHGKLFYKKYIKIERIKNTKYEIVLFFCQNRNK
jgi:hypothetical protein